MYKLIVSDFDHTLINDEEEIPVSTIILIDQLRRKGIKFAIATGRSLKSLLYYNKDFPFIDYMITSNGAYIYDVEKEKVIYKKNILISIVKKIIKEYYQDAIIYLTDHNTWNLISDESAYENDFDVNKPEDYQEFIKENKNNIYKMELYFKNLKKAKEVLKQIKEMNLKINANLQLDGDKNIIEITDSSVDKYQGTTKIISKMKINEEEVIAFGDGYNDMELIKQVGLGVAMKNSVSELKKVAKATTKDNNSKGVEEYLKKVIETGQ